MLLDDLKLKYKPIIEAAVEKETASFGPKTRLRDAIEYALKSGGKRFRAQLVLLVADALECPYAPIKAALAVEFFHTASLIADDLPCMDNDTMRRHLPSLHVAFDETKALLASYALISQGYALLAQSGSDPLVSLALKSAAKTTGIFGATGGQFDDIFPPKPLTEEEVSLTIEKKTGSLFELSFVLGWLFGGGEVTLLPLVQQAANHFGMAFQIADDLDDQAQDAKNKRLINYANVCGEKRAKEALKEHSLAFKELAKKLGLQQLESLVSWDL